MEAKERRIRNITQIYYSNTQVQEAIVKFAGEREVVPRYFESFGKRPDIIQYPSDVINLVKKGATSFHASEEIWSDPLKLSSEITLKEMKELRKGWDLVIDVDSRYFDLSREAAKLVLEFLEKFGIENYGIKFSGSKGFHIIVPFKAFPEEFKGQKTKEMFPEWPRTIISFIFAEIKPEFRRNVGKIMSFKSLKEHEEFKICCRQCEAIAEKDILEKLKCSVCNMEMERREVASSRKKIKCLNKGCAGIMEIIDSAEYYYCKNCRDPENEKFPLASNKYKEMFGAFRGEIADEEASFDLVLVAPRHLFRMPYSLHEKTALSSVVLQKSEIENFNMKNAEPFKVKIRNFLPKALEGEAKKLLGLALDWKTGNENEKTEERKYREFGNIDYKEINEKMFPEPIKKLLNGIGDGRKRGLFILITFFRALNFPPEYINIKIREWNEKNELPLKEGYVKSQIDWHLKQRKKIMPPNYSNESFYKDLGLIEKKPETKNPVVDVMRAMRRK